MMLYNKAKKTLLFLYLFIVISLFLSLLGWLNSWYVILILAAAFIFLNKNELREKKKIDKNFLIILFVVVFFLFGWMALRGFYTGDAYSYWLPWARDLYTTGRLSDFLQVPISYLSAGPAWPLFLAVIFGFLSPSALAVSWLPVLLFAVSVSFIYLWMREKGMKNIYLLFAFVFVFFNSQTAFWSWNMLVESLLFLAFLMFFYFWEKSFDSFNGKNILLLSMAFVLAVFVKFSSFLLLPLYAAVWIKNWRRIRVNYVLISLLVFIPLAVYLFRNYTVYGNPVFPLLSGLFSGGMATVYSLANPFDYWKEYYPTIWSRFVYMIKNFVFVYPFIFFTLIGFWKSKYRWYYLLQLGIAFLAGVLVIFSASSGMRYLWPYLGWLAVYAVWGLKYAVEQRNKVLQFLGLFVIVVSALYIPAVRSLSGFVSNIEEKFSFLFVLANFLQSNIYIAFLLSLLIAVLAVRDKRLFVLSALLFAGLSLFHLRWIYNKSFLIVWGFVLLFIFLVLVFSILSKYLLKIKDRYIYLLGILSLLGLFIVSSYGLAAVHYVKNRYLSWPHRQVFEKENIVGDYLQKVNPDNLPVISLTGFEYYIWYRNIPTAEFNSFYFVMETGKRVDKDTTSQELYDILKNSPFRFIVKTSSSFNSQLFYDLEKKLSDEYFDKICLEENVCIWKIK